MLRSTSFPSGSMVKNLPTIKEMLVQPLGGKDPLGKEMATPSFLPGKSHGQRSVVGYSQWGHKELDTWRLNNKLRRTL